MHGRDLGRRHLLAGADHLAVARVAGEQLLGALVPEQPRQRLQLGDRVRPLPADRKAQPFQQPAHHLRDGR